MRTELTKYVIKRKDMDNDDLVIEGDSLTVGSALGNDVLLNHPTVSRTHAGICEIEGAFWIKNLSSSNGTIVNGSLIETVQLQTEDSIQVGVFVLKPTVNEGEMILEVEKQIDRVAAGVKGAEIVGDPKEAMEKGKTSLLSPDLLKLMEQAQKPAAQQPSGQTGKPSATSLLGAGRFQRGMTGLLSSIMALPEQEQARFQQSLDAFWDRRKIAETGGGQKMAEISILRPREPDPEYKQFNLHLGKKKFNWLPTTDLVRPWPRGYLITIGSFLILAGIIAVFLWERAYSPGPIALPHTYDEKSMANFASFSPGSKTLMAASKAADGERNCASCHTATSSMQQKCIDCHKTSHFEPTNAIPLHEQAGVSCVDCHTEHKGKDFKPAIVARTICFDCHRDNPTHPKAKTVARAGVAGGELLKTPHGSNLGYPIDETKPEADRWTWKDPINKKIQIPDAAQLSPKAKFHFVHLSGRKEATGRGENAAKCMDCHDSFESPAATKTIDKNKCAICHGVAITGATTAQGKPLNQVDDMAQLSTSFKIDCNSCHPQHNESKDLVAALRPKGGKARTIDPDKDIYRVNTVYRGGKDWQWTSFAARFGGMSFKGWGLFLSIVPLVVIGFLAFDTIRRRQVQELLKGKQISLSAEKVFDPQSMKYALKWESEVQKQRAEAAAKSRPVPQPVINNETCIGCHGCILACPQDVLAFDDQEHHAIVVNYEQCMEDTGCQQACPTVPQSCVLINTKKNIKEAPKPLRKGMNDGFETEHVEGAYLIGDVSGVPLIRNAIKEGRLAMDKIAEKLKEKKVPGADYDVAIVGIGPGGISATVRAAELGLTYVALEQGRKYATIADKYPAGKYVAFNPFNPNDPPLGAVKLDGPGDLKEKMLGWWEEAASRFNVQVNEFEGCREITQENGYFVLKTTKKPEGYKARKIVLSLGNAGEPRKLGVPGEVDVRVEYRLQDPAAYKGKKIVVVGAGNSAVEAAVDLAGKRQADGTVVFSEGGNEVSLVVRSDFPKDLTLENKMWVYFCMDSGRMKAYFGAAIKEIRDKEVVLSKVRDGSVIGTIPNDIVFAMVGSIAPKEFLSKVGIKYAGDDKKGGGDKGAKGDGAKPAK
jgi:thioredoxin reductase (NADPH)